MVRMRNPNAEMVDNLFHQIQVLLYCILYIYTCGHLSNGQCGQTSTMLQNLQEAMNVCKLALLIVISCLHKAAGWYYSIHLYSQPTKNLETAFPKN